MSTAPPLILLVEDNPDDELMTLQALKENGLASNVTVTRDGEAAVDFLFRTGSFRQRSPEPPAVVLLDLKLPKIDGLEVLTRVRADATLKYLPVVILTSSAEDRDLVEGYRLAVSSYIRKPVEFAELVEAFRQLGIQWSMLH